MASTENPSMFSQKLRRLVEGHVKTEIDAGAGLRKGTISLILHRGNTPSLDDARRIANYFNVSKDWLFDEGDESLDPPKQSVHGYGSALDQFTTDALLDEVGKRYWPLAVAIGEGIKAFETFDLHELAQAAMKITNGGAVTEKQQAQLSQLRLLLKQLDDARRFMPDEAASEWEAGRCGVQPKLVSSPEQYRVEVEGDDESYDDLPYLICELLETSEQSKTASSDYMRKIWADSAIQHAEEIRSKLDKNDET